MIQKLLILSLVFTPAFSVHVPNKKARNINLLTDGSSLESAENGEDVCMHGSLTVLV